MVEALKIGAAAFGSAMHLCKVGSVTHAHLHVQSLMDASQADVEAAYRRIPYNGPAVMQSQRQKIRLRSLCDIEYPEIQNLTRKQFN